MLRMKAAAAFERELAQAIAARRIGYELPQTVFKFSYILGS